MPPAKPWDIHVDQLIGGVIDEPLYNDDDDGRGYVDDMQQMEGTKVNSLGFLASQFPGFLAESLTEVYYANGCDLNLTIEMLTQLEFQVDNGLNQNLNSKALSAPNRRAPDFPTLPPTDNPFSGHEYAYDQQRNVKSYRFLKKVLLMFKSSYNTLSSIGATYVASQDSSIWKYNRNHPSQNSTIGSSRSSHGFSLTSGYDGYWGRVANRSTQRDYG